MSVRFLLPNAFTSLNFLMGTFSILLSTMAGETILGQDALVLAAWLIVYSVLFDKVDGFLAKRLDASSDFGAEFDSLADLISFGLAPAMLLYAGVRQAVPDPNPLFLIPALAALSLYVLCAAIRLARYNVSQSGIHGYFQGMPTTLSGGWIALIFLMLHKYDRVDDVYEWIPAIEIVLALLMVSPLYLSKLVRRKNQWFNLFQVANIAMGYVCGLLMKLPEIMTMQIALYTSVGFVWGILNRRRIIAEVRAEAESD